jgi:hypothetical protein
MVLMILLMKRKKKKTKMSTVRKQMKNLTATF